MAKKQNKKEVKYKIDWGWPVYLLLFGVIIVLFMIQTLVSVIIGFILLFVLIILACIKPKK